MNTALANPTASLPPEVAGFCSRAVEALRAKLPVREVWLFGSYAEGRANEHSDVDLFVVLPDDHGMTRPNLECFRVVSRLINRPPVDVVSLNEGRWNDPKYRTFGLWGDVATKGIRMA